MTVELPYIGRTRSLSQRVADELAERILAGTWDEGRRLPSEPELSAQFGVSRSVVRDAIRTLAARGLVYVRQGYGTVVRAPSDERCEEALFELLVRSDVTMRDVWLARQTVDVALAPLAAERRTEGDLAALRTHLDQMIEAEREEDWDRIETSHLHFHLGILDAAQLPALRLILQPMQRIIIATGLPASADPAGWGVEAHIPVYETIATGDPEAARGAMVDHYEFARDPAYDEFGAMQFREFPSAQERLRPRKVEGKARRRARRKA